jgi:sulfotransferase
MKTIHYAIGLPRSGSTLLMNILQQNPDIFTSSTCPTTYFVEGAKQAASNIPEFLAMEQDQLNTCFNSFLKHGVDGWFSGLTDKPIVISKCRGWDRHMNFLFHAYDEPKFIVILRDLRDIICSFEKLSHKYNFWAFGTQQDPIHLMPFDKRIEMFCTDSNGTLGIPLKNLPHVVEWMMRKPNNFFLCRFEDFNREPNKILKDIYTWLGYPEFQHDLNNVKMSEQYEHDTTYRALVSHKTDPKVRYLEPSWPKMMNKEQSNAIIQNNLWYYKTFYPEILSDNQDTNIWKWI